MLRCAFDGAYCLRWPPHFVVVPVTACVLALYVGPMSITAITINVAVVVVCSVAVCFSCAWHEMNERIQNRITKARQALRYSEIHFGGSPVLLLRFTNGACTLYCRVLSKVTAMAHGIFLSMISWER